MFHLKEPLLNVTLRHPESMVINFYDNDPLGLQRLLCKNNDVLVRFSLTKTNVSDRKQGINLNKNSEEILSASACIRVV